MFRTTGRSDPRPSAIQAGLPAASIRWGVPAVILIAASLAPGTPNQQGSEEAPSAQWPAYRRGSDLSGFSPLVGGLAQAPIPRWEFDLGGADVATEQAQMVDVNGDGRVELLRVLSDCIICQSLDGQLLWQTQPMAKPRVLQIRDFAGDGTRGLLIESSSGVAHDRYMVSGVTGKAAFLFSYGNAFGLYDRFGNILAGVRGEQLCVWWSGDVENRPAGGLARGIGYLWSFEDGVESPNLRFHASEEGTIYAPLHLFADMNADGHTDMVMISHEAMWVYDLETGARTMHAGWGPQIRTYWAHTAAIPLVHGEPPSLVMINPMIPGIQLVTQDGKTARMKWKKVIGGVENQYQAQVKIDRAAPDPFVDLDGDGEMEILVAVTNEHRDEKTHLVIFGASDGDRKYDAADQAVITVDDLDGAAPPEVVLSDGKSLRICNWTGTEFVDRWRAEEVSPLVMPAPTEGNLTRAVGARSSSVNMPVWRAQPGGDLFLLRFGDGVWSCRLHGNEIQRIAKVTDHEALAVAAPLPSGYSWNGQELQAQRGETAEVIYRMPRRPSYSPMPPIAGRLGNGMRIVIREFSGALVSLAADGSDRCVLIEQSPPSAGVCITDLNGDGENEVLGLSASGGGVAKIVAVDAAGKTVLQIQPPEGATEVALGPTGRLGRDRRRWFVARYRIAYQNTRVVAYDGSTAEALWTRDFLGPQPEPATTFVLHLPTAVHDVDADGADDLIASSENWYEVISVKDNRSLTPTRTITAAVPGHWGAYATPIVVHSSSRGPSVFHNNAYALSLLTKLDGMPVWHYGLTRDTTHASLAGVADLDGDAAIELVTTQKDGMLRAFDASALDRNCPSCPVGQKPSETNRTGNVRWSFRLPPPISDFASLDAEGDGRTELLCGAGDGKLYLLKEHDGECRMQWSVDLGAQVMSPVIVDLDGDRSPEILVSTSDGRLHCLGHPGAP